MLHNMKFLFINLYQRNDFSLFLSCLVSAVNNNVLAHLIQINQAHTYTHKVLTSCTHIHTPYTFLYLSISSNLLQLVHHLTHTYTHRKRGGGGRKDRDMHKCTYTHTHIHLYFISRKIFIYMTKLK